MNELNKEEMGGEEMVVTILGIAVVALIGLCVYFSITSKVIEVVKEKETVIQYTYLKDGAVWRTVNPKSESFYINSSYYCFKNDETEKFIGGIIEKIKALKINMVESTITMTAQKYNEQIDEIVRIPTEYLSELSKSDLWKEERISK